MGHLKNHRSLKPPLRTFAVWVFHLRALFLLTLCCGGASPEAPPPSTVAMRGHDIALPCHIEPAVDAVGMTVEWGRPDLNPRFVFVQHGGKVLMEEQNQAYRGRASLSEDAMKHGDVSLQLSNLRTSDTGTYRCFIPAHKKEYFIQLLVGAADLPVITLAGIDKTTGRVVLECKCSGWYPEPEVSWMDAEGHLVSAGPPETLRGPDALYTVNSRVTVEQRHGGTFTCRVHQNRTNQTREAQIRVPDDFFLTPPSCVVTNTTSVLFALMFILLSVVFVWKWRCLKKEIKKLQEIKTAVTEGENNLEHQSLIERKENKKAIRDLEKKRETLKDELKKNEVEQKDVEKGIKTLMDRYNELIDQKKQIQAQKDEAEKKRVNTEETIRKVETEAGGNKGNNDNIVTQAKAYVKLKEIIKEEHWVMEDKAIKYEERQKTVENILQWMRDEHQKMSKKKTELENHRKKINEQLEEVESKLSET